MRISIFLLSVVLISGCASDAAEEIDPACQQGAELIERCAGGVPDAFYQACEDDPSRAEELTAAECTVDPDKGDGWIGWKDWGERCWFNWECAGELACRPLDMWASSDTACMEPGHELGQTSIEEHCGDWCDDDDDCAPGLLCRDERNGKSGMCASADHEVDSQVECAVEFH